MEIIPAPKLQFSDWLLLSGGQCFTCALCTLQAILEAGEKKLKFWETEPKLYDDINHVGLRYVSFYKEKR